MSNDTTRPSPDEIRRAVARGRRDWVNRLATEFRPAANRLLQAYQGIIPELERVIDDMSKIDAPSRDEVRASEALSSMTRTMASDIDSMRGLIIDESADLQERGADTGARHGVQMLNAGGMSVGYNQPLAATIQSAINYVDSPQFRDALNALGTYHAEKARDIVLAGVASGQNPRQISKILSDYFVVRKVPTNDMMNLVQTTHVYSARQGQRIAYQQNGISRWRWSANIGDPRTCRACVAMHGTVHPTSKLLNDHHRGRCGAVPITPAWEELGFADGETPAAETGVTWFNRQDAETQQQVLNNRAMYDKIQQGEIAFHPDIIVGEYENPIFGRMRRAKSLREILNQ